VQIYYKSKFVFENRFQLLFLNPLTPDFESARLLGRNKLASQKASRHGVPKLKYAPDGW